MMDIWNILKGVHNIINVIERFLDDEISNQELYEAIIDFITHPHIRNGEFEGNYFIIKKMDPINFFIYAENIYPDNHREIPYSTSIYCNNLVALINEHAKKQGYKLIQPY
jgi:hypothetical protein